MSRVVSVLYRVSCFFSIDLLLSYKSQAKATLAEKATLAARDTQVAKAIVKEEEVSHMFVPPSHHLFFFKKIVQKPSHNFYLLPWHLMPQEKGIRAAGRDTPVGKAAGRDTPVERVEVRPYRSCF